MLLYSRAVMRAGINGVRRLAGAEPLDDKQSVRAELKQAGQIVVIFALMLTALIGLVGIALDTTYAWREALRVQRASDAAALAGVVYLPGNYNGAAPNAMGTAQNEAAKNGFPASGTTSISIPPPVNPRELDVSITTQVPTFFARIFGINTFTVTRSSKAVYVLPVPMGSPENYYGSFGSFKVNGSPVPLKGPDASGNPTGAAMNTRGFWGSTLTQGADIGNGDAYMPKFNGSGSNAGQDTINYHNYGIYMPPGSTAGDVWIFDPVFCDTDSVQGTGEFWLGGTGAAYTKYELYNTNNSPYMLSAQTFLGSSGNLFSNMSYSDSQEGGSGGSACTPSPSTNQSDPRYWHNKWWKLTGGQGANQQLSGGATGQTYRIHVTTDPGDSSQDSVNALNNFAIFASATGGSPQVYGIGAMQMYTPLPQNSDSTFYLAQIDKQSGAGKTIEISLWDPGDTGTLTADLTILQPTTSGWSAVNMTWSAQKVAVNGANCNGNSGGLVGSVRTSSSGTHIFNGCWLTIDIVIPISYTAEQSGWWKINYHMGSGSSPSTDETTWQVNIRGNPVHLI